MAAGGAEHSAPVAGEPSERQRVLAEIASMSVPSWDEFLIDEDLSEEDSEKDRVFFETITNA